MQKTKVYLSKLLLIILLACNFSPVASTYLPAPFTVTAEAAYNKATIKKVQEALNKLDYDCGTPDGIAGDNTKSAIKKYQDDHDLKVTGKVNSKLLDSLAVKVVKDSVNANSEKKETTVYTTDTGSKYHTSGCRYLKKSKHSISLSDAKSQGYTACSVCKP